MLFIVFINSIYAQNLVTLDKSIQNSFEYIEQRIIVNTKIAIINIQSDYPNLSDYIITKLMSFLVNSNKFVIVDRRNLEILEKELKFNMSGMISDETAQRIGKMVGAQSVITGNIKPLGDVYKFDFNIIEVETTRIQGIFSELIMEDQILSTLIGKNTNLGKSIKRDQRNMTFYWLYFGIKPSFGLHFYDTKNTIYNSEEISTNGSLNLALQMTIRPFQYFAIQVEPAFTVDSILFPYREYVYDSNNITKYYYDTNLTYEHHSLLLPILLRGIFDYNSLTFSVLAGTYINLPLGSIKQNNSFSDTNKSSDIDSNFGFMCGINAGVKIGQGNIFIDIRYATDFSNTYFNDLDIYRRSILFLGIGYEIGLFENTKRRNK